MTSHLFVTADIYVRKSRTSLTFYVHVIIIQ